MSTPALRHLDYGDDAGVARLGSAGLQAILDGYDVAAWAPILREVRNEPWGEVAQRLERVVDHLESYGTSSALRAWLLRCRGGLTAPVRTLADLRREVGLSQRELAQRMGVSQAQVARVESSASPTWRTLSRYLEALGLQPSVLVATGRQAPMAVRISRHL